MTIQDDAERIGRRFHQQHAPTTYARVRPSVDPVIVSHVEGLSVKPEKTLEPPVERAFSIHVYHKPLAASETWIDGVNAKVPFIPTAGICIFDLETKPVAIIREPFEFSRIQIKRSTLEELAYHEGLPRFYDLKLPEFGHIDQAIYHMALTLVARRGVFGEERDSLFSDWIALAFNAHILASYGSSEKIERSRDSLPPNQLRFISDWMIDRLACPLSIADMANALDMTPSRFAKAFCATTGSPPHRWMMQRRIDRAKTLLALGQTPLAEIATRCGFVDQSHFTRVFRRVEGQTPGQWRHQAAR